MLIAQHDEKYLIGNQNAFVGELHFVICREVLLEYYRP
jgi:hypothetical protein